MTRHILIQTTILNKYGYINTVGYNSFESKKHKCNKL